MAKSGSFLDKIQFIKLCRWNLFLPSGLWTWLQNLMFSMTNQYLFALLSLATSITTKLNIQEQPIFNNNLPQRVMNRLNPEDQMGRGVIFFLPFFLRFVAILLTNGKLQKDIFITILIVDNKFYYPVIEIQARFMLKAIIIQLKDSVLTLSGQWCIRD